MSCESKKLGISNLPDVSGIDLHQALERSGVAGHFWHGALSAALAARAGQRLPSRDAD